jgi:hypothetical protein
MILKLMMPKVNKRMREGEIIKWYKAEGEWVDYGDELFDVRVLMIPLRRMTGLLEKLKMKTVASILRASRDLDEMLSEMNTSAFIYVRVVSSDRGYLRTIRVHTDGCQEVGEVIALFTTAVDEDIALDKDAIAGASSFRVVAYPI